MWILRLNDMRAPKIEMLEAVAISETQQGLIDFLRSQKVEQYEDGQWRKSFKKEGPLEWFNPPQDGPQNFINIGTEEIAIEKARERYRELVSSLPRV